MAEYVNQMLEEMIPELEEMTNLGLFTAKETKIIKKNREYHEYRVRQVTRTKASFLNYIAYEKKLLELLKIKRKKMSNDSKKREIEKSIADRIHQLYRLVVVRFKDDVSLWRGHIEFSKAMNEKAYVTRLYEKVLRLHPHNEELYIESAQWESSMEGNVNHALAREILLKAHRDNPESQMIFLEMLHMELQLAKQIIRRKAILGISKTQEENESDSTDTAETDKAEEWKLAEILYNQGRGIFHGLSSFHLKMLSIVSKFKEAKELKSRVVSDLKTLYPEDPAVWNGLALLNLNNINKLDAADREAAVADCLKTFDDAVSQLATEDMWTYCLNAHLNLLDVKDVVSSYDAILTSLLTMFHRAVSAGLLAEPLYVELISLLTSLSFPDDAERVAAAAVIQHPASPRLWLAKLRVVALEDNDETLVACLKAAQKRVPPEKSWPLWEFALNMLASRGKESLDQLEGLMERACRVSTKEVCCPARIWCLNWTFQQSSMKSFRIAYNSLKNMRPINVAFYRMYIEKECSAEEPNLKLIRAAFEESLAAFGLNEPDLWLNYMEMERKVANDPAKSGLIQERAVRGLDPHLKETFIRKQMMLGFGWDTHH